jgi:hypothetical protein
MNRRGLSFSEVKRAGLNARQQSGGYQYWFDELDCSERFEGLADCTGTHARPVQEPEATAPTEGWHHVPDCRCSLCVSRDA